MPYIVFEVNEIPLCVLEKYISNKPKSNIAKLRNRIITKAEDLPEEELYPSQTWASINTGKSFNEHRVKWFSDRLALEDLYWNKVQKTGKKVSVVGSLHTSPANSFLTSDHNFVCFIPDFFSNDNKTYPKNFQAFQEFNIKVTDENKRFSNLSLLWSAFKSFLTKPNLFNWGLNNFLALKQVITIIISSIFVNKERLRLAQFSLSCSIFFNSLRKKPDLAIIFTNHVASMMHRYLHAYIESKSNPYGEDWNKKYCKEVEFSIDLLDEWIGKIMKASDKDATKIIMLSSMGQKINEEINQEHVSNFQADYVLKDPHLLLEKLVENLPPYTQRGVMVPQYAFNFSNSSEAFYVHEQLSKIGTDKNLRFGHYTNNKNESTNIKGMYLNSDVNNDVVTLSVQLNQDIINIYDNEFNFSKLGFTKVSTDNHHSGEHDKNGILWSNFLFSNQKEINYLDFSKIFADHLENKT